MKYLSLFVWSFGRLLQMGGLVTTAYALWIGLSSGDSRSEITWLGIGAGEFLLGVFCLKASRGSSA